MAMPSLIHQLDDKINSGASNNVLSFEQHKPQLIIPHQDEYSMWDQENLMSSTDDHCRSPSRLFDDFSSQEGAFAWLYSDGAILAPVCVHDHTTLPQKRPHLGESTNTQATKKQCTTKNKQKQSGSSSLASKDPQSIAAKNRRERISERLKILQELIPNGCKVDLVTMLEKAISYVKFLQLQVKVLATDEFWPEQGGKAPDISQVKEAIDAILSSQIRETQAHPLCHEAINIGNILITR